MNKNRLYSRTASAPEFGGTQAGKNDPSGPTILYYYKFDNNNTVHRVKTVWGGGLSVKPNEPAWRLSNHYNNNIHPIYSGECVHITCNRDRQDTTRTHRFREL